MKSTQDPLASDGPNVIRNLMKSPKSIDSVYVYDKRGSALFEKQSHTPEYYLRRVETQLLHAHAREIISLCGFLPVVELGAGTAEKTRILLAQYKDRGVRCDYFPIDVDGETLTATAHGLAASFPLLSIHCAATTYLDGLRALPRIGSGRLFLILGSSLGNLSLHAIDELLSELFYCGSGGDYLLLGADLDKDPGIINRAYNDSQGYGPQSTLNMLWHLNWRYDGNFVMDNFRYRSEYDSQAKKNEVRIESLVYQVVTLTRLDFTLSLGAGELIDAEVMWKFDPEELGASLDRAGFSMVNRWIDPVYRYGLFLLRRR